MDPTSAGISELNLPEPVSVEQALNDPGGALDVPDGEELVVGPFAHHSRFFRIAEVSRFDDLRLLGVVHDRLSEEESVAAIREDDREYERVVRSSRSANPNLKGSSDCGCGCEGTGISRHQYHDRFAELLQPLFRERLASTDAAVLHPYGHIKRWISRNQYVIGLFSLTDIHIGTKATLTMTPTVRFLYANEITIEDLGTLRFQSGTVHVRCNVLNGPEKLVKVDRARYLDGLSFELAVNN